MNQTLAAWNAAERKAALDAMLSCCCARRWAEGMVERRPLQDVPALSLTADEVWASMTEPDWMEAFACHPRIGDRKAAHASAKSVQWSQQEQASAGDAEDRVLAELAEGNALYEDRFRFTYIVCATGRSADEMLAILKRRLGNERAAELKEAAEQQRQITQIRLGKWLIE